jgi:2-succinyl-5-enolpyruvyl-6-hydroxy-3-cyclohexene-1-carboxylate synthase
LQSTGCAADEAHLLGEWARLLFGTLRETGISDLFVSPGSRSTPFTWQALHTRGLVCHAIVDERSAAFAALGFARATGRPAALLCTSGSAPAHYFPAVVEAALAFLPLLVITADRPVEVQHSGAAQCIDQVKLYGDHVRCYFELGLPDAAPRALAGLRRVVGQAVSISQGAVPGPVHLNARARKPLEPRPAACAQESALAARVSALLTEPLTRHAACPAAPDSVVTRQIAEALLAARAGAIVVGALPPARKAIMEPLAELATALGLPILAEASSQVRFALSSHPLACPEFPWLLSTERSRRMHAPDLLLCLGAAPMNGGFESWALESGAVRYVLADHGSPDPLGGARIMTRGALESWLEALCREVTAIHDRRGGQRCGGPEQAAFTRALLESGRLCRDLISEELASEPGLAEGTAVACIARALPAGAQWMLGNSLPIRDVDAYVSRAADAVVLSQRGANGIDGLVSAAAGSALATRLPTLLLLGDVSLLHDVGGLAVARMVATPLVLAVLDNVGGRIFDQLPVHDLYEAEPDACIFWRTPPGCDFKSAAQLFGLQYASPTSEAELASATREAFQRNSATLLHVRVGPDSARRVRERVLARLAARCAEAGG